ncbi:UDP-3-O-(3-hydroxymyristoyl)glucosamine N-acyltransferase [Solimicrobium silvestre]|uniref:UDP-3-O-acylglucosamine N-acyltransferase n=1 Tax=Solimicrobium silvestre TaxID=2099400 RepID=A0A2S9GWW8_9BURK|nr:UDP-3-O-(3-hydroxymyristoyl)glucosamine N-acyltransferase [Solimicrobium silvestre]PRC92156.1 UDP-3-O-[3-hydroxymyristoyl] glucosamine N-acyltransferase [Solimicrobium silvestre]
MSGLHLSELIDRLGGQLICDTDLVVDSIAPLEHAHANSITFLSNPKLRNQAGNTLAAAIIIKAADAEFLRSQFKGALILVDNPYAYFAKTAQLFAELKRQPLVPGIHPSASVDPTARIAASAAIGPLVCIEENAVIGEHVQIDAGCFIGHGAQIGAHSHFHANVTWHHECRIGQRAIIYSGAVIGGEGFGFANEAGRWLKIPQTGGVAIGDDVEIGANTCIDRGALTDTIIEDGVKLDNQIQIGHNCHIGAHTAMAGCVGVAGSAKIGSHCTFGGAAMVLGHLTIADNVHISSGSMVSRSILEAGQYTGFYPLAKNADWEKSAAIVRNLDSLRDKVRAMEKTIQSLTSAQNGKKDE